MTNRQQQRQLQRAVTKRGEAILATGLPPTPEKSDLVALAFCLARLLSKADDPARASNAARAALAMQEASRRRTPGTAKLACAKGCDACCHSWVGATAPEIFHLAQVIAGDRSRSPLEHNRILAASRLTAGRSPAERFGAKLPCPLLVDGVCSRYRERPVVCRQTTSLDLAACLDEFEGRGYGGDIKVSAIYVAHARNARLPLLAALRIAGLPTRIYELSHGLVLALDTPDAERRWLAGENVLAGPGETPRESPEIEKAVEMLAAEARALQ